MREDVRNELLSLAEEEYKEFSEALVPGEDKILGIRLPILRKIAKRLAAGNWKQELDTEDIYFEEIMLRGMIISYATCRLEPEEAFVYIRDFIPCVKNWSVCDSCFMKMDILKKDRELTWKFILPYMDSGDEFKVRTALIIMMSHLVNCDNEGRKYNRLRSVSMENLENAEEERKRSGKYLSLVFAKVNRKFTEGYYAHMAAAWLLAECFCMFPALTHQFLCMSDLDDATYNKTLQKIIESRIPDEEVKQYMKSMKRKKIK